MHGVSTMLTTQRDIVTQRNGVACMVRYAFPKPGAVHLEEAWRQLHEPGLVDDHALASTTYANASNDITTCQTQYTFFKPGPLP